MTGVEEGTAVLASRANQPQRGEPSPSPRQLLEQLEHIRDEVLRLGGGLMSSWSDQIHRPEFAPSARNLAHYLALRQLDLRDLQLELMPWGLSSLGRSESRVLETLDSVIATLRTICGLAPRAATRFDEFFRGDLQLDREAELILGAPPANRRTRIMVTFPTTAAEDYAFVRALVLRGMDVARINCAHDSRADWQSMVGHVRRAERETGRSCRIAMDVAGPRIRVRETNFDGDRRFKRGDEVLLTRSAEPAIGIEPAIVCSIPAAVDHLEVGHAVWFDDGLIGSRVQDIRPEGAVLRIEQVAVRGERIRPAKGINCPDTDLELPALTPKDLEDLDFVAEHADIVNYSFVRNVEDIRLLQAELARRIPDESRLARLAIVAKVETRDAVRNLPDLIVAAAGVQPFGVMIARGDLAVEIGFERLAEIQEEILWVCEAAHTPVIWATQVFESYVKTGLATRSEVTDAAMAERAECVMLNKGDFALEAVGLLDDVIVRMEGHQFKKRAELRALHSWPIPNQEDVAVHL